MTASQHPARRIPWVLTEAGRQVADEMLAKRRRAALRATRRDRRWTLTDAAIALLDSEDA